MKAIVYTSNTGHTERYAKMLSEKIGLPTFTIEEAKKQLPKGTEIIYMGWLFATSVKGYNKVKRRYKICAVCAVGLCETGYLLKEVRNAISLPKEIPLFTLQGGITLEELKGINKTMIATLTKFFKKKKNPTEDDKKMIELLSKSEDFVDEKNLLSVLEWYKV